MRPGGISGVQLMDLQSRSNGSGESEALERSTCQFLMVTVPYTHILLKRKAPYCTTGEF